MTLKNDSEGHTYTCLLIQPLRLLSSATDRTRVSVMENVYSLEEFTYFTDLLSFVFVNLYLGRE